MRSFAPSKPTIAAFAGLSLVGALAGCSAAPANAGPGAPTSARATTAPTTTASSTGGYKDGTYTESASYQAPSGTEALDVTLTLAGNIVTAVTVVGHATDPQAKLYQGQFAGGIGAIVVGKKLDTLKVDKVGGSSLTSGGFNKAIDTIKTDAAS